MDSSPSGAMPGWYPDPTSSTPLLRYWDGREWTSNTMLPARPEPAKSESPRPSRFRAVKWGAVAAFLLVASVVGVALYRGQVVCSVDTTGKVTFAAHDGQCVNKAELATKQEEMKEEVQQEKALLPAPEVVQDVVSFDGTWADALGLRYVITQVGDQATIEEYTPGFGLTATGSGQAIDDLATFTFRAYDGTTGTAAYRMLDANSLAGMVTNDVTATQQPHQLIRVG